MSDEDMSNAIKIAAGEFMRALHVKIVDSMTGCELRHILQCSPSHARIQGGMSGFELRQVSGGMSEEDVGCCADAFQRRRAHQGLHASAEHLRQTTPPASAKLCK